MKLTKMQDPSISEGRSQTFGVFMNELSIEPEYYISLNSSLDDNLGIDDNELVIWTPEDGELWTSNNSTNSIISQIQGLLGILKSRNIEVDNIEKEVYELSTPE